MINIEIKDYNSKIIGLIPSHLHEPIVLIAKIKDFESIDDYVIDVIERELESIRDGGEKTAEFGNFISDYLEKIIIPSPPDDDSSPKQESSSSSTE